MTGGAGRRRVRTLAPVTARPGGPGAAIPRADAWLAGGLLLLTFLLGCFRAWDTDLWWHLRTGQLIWQRGAIPRVDWFTFTSPNAPWIDLHWGFQLIVAALYAIGGIPLLVLAKALAGVGIVGTALAARRPGYPLALAVALWIPPLVVLTGRLYERPEVVTLLFLAAFLLVIFQSGDRPRGLWLLPLMQVLWVNLHGLFIMGPVVLAMLWGDRIVAALGRPRWLIPPGGAGAPDLTMRHLAGPTAATIAACFVNPYFAEGVFFPFVLFQKVGGSDGFYRRTIAELGGTFQFIKEHGVFSNIYIGMILLTLVLMVASFVLLALKGRVSPFRLALGVAFTYLCWQARRNSNLYALVLAVVTSWNAGDIWLLVRAGTAGRTAPARGPTPASAARVVLGVALAVACWLVVSDTFYDYAGEDRKFGTGERQDWFMHGAAEYLARPGMPSGNLAYDLGQASLFLYHAGPEKKCFLDPRLEVNPRSVLQTYLDIGRAMIRGEKDWPERYLGTGNPGTWPSVMLSTRTARNMITGLLGDPRWRPVYADATGVAFVPTEVAERLHLAAIPVTPQTIPVPRN